MRFPQIAIVMMYCEQLGYVSVGATEVEHWSDAATYVKTQNAEPEAYIMKSVKEIHQAADQIIAWVAVVSGV